MTSLLSDTQSPIPHFEKYSYISTLGEGSFGRVFFVKDNRTNQEYALKLLKLWDIPAIHQNNIKKRFELEFQTGRINSPYLVNTYEMDYANDLPFFTMDYCPNSNLERKIHAGIQTGEVAKLGMDMISGLHVLHQNGKIHRDLKPENILFDREMNPRLSDFGICGHLNHSLTQVNSDNKPSQIFGSYAYMAPEQLNPKKQQDTILPACDIFSLGVILFEMYTGKLPFGPWNDISDIQPYLDRASVGRFESLPDDVPNDWKYLIYNCLQPDRESRYKNIEEVMNAIGMHSIDGLRSGSPGKASVQVMQGEEYGKVYHLINKNQYLIGRDTYTHINDIAIVETLSSYISRKQATIEKYDARYYIRDGQWCNDSNILALPQKRDLCKWQKTNAGW
ncbi:MAG: protein kinase [Saprospiraceae bacterium]|nr:protein kinase [Saprospiraceae bacterium]